jgi:hypothetical protein
MNGARKEWKGGVADGEEASVSLVCTLMITDRPTPPIRASCCAHGNNLFGQWRKYIRIL